MNSLPHVSRDALPRPPMKSHPSRPAPRATLREVAAAAGISLTAASFALNGTGSVSARVKQRVTAEARKLGYRLDQRVSEIMRRVRRDHHAAYRETIAVLDTWPTRGGWHEPVANARYRKGMLTRAATLGYELQEHWLNEPGMTPRRIGSILRARGIRGVLVPPVIRRDAASLLDWAGFTSVTIGPSLDVPIHRVCNHRFRTLRTAIDRLLDLGYQRLGFVMVRHPLQVVEEFWCSGFITYQAQLTARQRVPTLIYEPGDLARVERWYRKYRPDAVLLHDMDQVMALRAAGLEPGKSGAIAHLNWSPATAQFAGVDQRAEIMGATAVDCLMGQLLRNETGLPEAPQEIMIDSLWRDGPSAPRRAR